MMSKRPNQHERWSVLNEAAAERETRRVNRRAIAA